MKNENILMRGDPKKFIKMELSTLLAKMYYPTVLSNLFLNYGLEKATEYLNSIGDRAAKYFLQYYQPKADTPFKMVKEMSKFVGKSYEIKRNPKDRTYVVRTKKCPLCHDMPELNLPGLKNCQPISGFINGFFKYVVPLKNPKLINYKAYQGTITKSVASGDKYCELIIKNMEEL
jgi:predicted hydrocarbon binding protein